MRKAALVTGFVAVAAAFTWANAATVAYKSNLAGTAEVPPVQTTGKGAATVNVDTATKQASWRGEDTRPRRPAPAAPIPPRAAPPAEARGAPPPPDAAARPLTPPPAVSA